MGLVARRGRLLTPSLAAEANLLAPVAKLLQPWKEAGATLGPRRHPEDRCPDPPPGHLPVCRPRPHRRGPKRARPGPRRGTCCPQPLPGPAPQQLSVPRPVLAPARADRAGAHVACALLRSRLCPKPPTQTQATKGHTLTRCNLMPQGKGRRAGPQVRAHPRGPRGLRPCRPGTGDPNATSEASASLYTNSSAKGFWLTTCLSPWSRLAATVGERQGGPQRAGAAAQG